jgi:hypothetical protein
MRKLPKCAPSDAHIKDLGVRFGPTLRKHSVWDPGQDSRRGRTKKEDVARLVTPRVVQIRWGCYDGGSAGGSQVSKGGTSPAQGGWRNNPTPAESILVCPVPFAAAELRA